MCGFSVKLLDKVVHISTIVHAIAKLFTPIVVSTLYFSLESSSSLVSSEDLLSAWDKEGEKERILRGLDAILEKEEDELEEADMFLDPVDLDEEPTYCTVVPFPTSVFTIAERMRNGFYR